MLSKRRCARSAFALFASALLATGIAAAKPAHTATALPPESQQAPATDCTTAVGYNVNRVLPGYRLPDAQFATTCVPFTQVPLAPEDYQGDYRVREFSDQAARARLAACEVQPPCAAIENARSYILPHRRP